MSESTPPDHQSPHRIIRASAGAGKTYQLTQHTLELLRRGAAVDSILATTFTRKAAGEILSRLVRVLLAEAKKERQHPETVSAPEDEPDPAKRRKPYRQVLDEVTRNLHRVGVSTIDSFFHRLGGGFRFELDLPLEPRLIEEGSPEAAALRAEAITAVLAEASADDTTFRALLDLLRRLHHDQTTRSVTRAIDDIVMDHAEIYRAAPEAETWNTLQPRGLMDASQLQDQLARWRQMREALPLTGKGLPNKTWEKSWVATGQAAAAGDWDSVIDAGILKKIVNGEAKFGTAAISDHWIDAAQPWINHARATLIEQINRQTSATHELMRRFALVYERLRARRGVMLFSDMAHRLAGGLLAGRDVREAEVLTEIYFRLDAAVTHLLLDEFQDTSLDQWQVLEPFVDQIGSTGDGSRSLLVVGDSKQAIYGWRGGCVELFDTVEQNVSWIQRESLAVSWRSSPTVLDAVNRVFGGLADWPTLVDSGEAIDAEAAAQWAAGFEPHRAAYDDRPGVVVLDSSPVPDEPKPKSAWSDRDAADSDHEEGDEDLTLPASSHEAFVAQQIKDIYQRTGARSLGVLTRGNKMVRRLLHELQSQGLPASGEGGNPIADVPAVAAVLSALQMADHPGDSAAVFHTLNSPMGRVVSLSRMADAAAAARRIRQFLLRDGYAQTIARWTTALAPHADAADLGKLARLVGLAEQYEAGLAASQQLRPARFVDFIEGTEVEEPSPSPIRVMTIHRSKGLEFDTVVLPELDAGFSNRFATLTDRPDPTGPIEAVFRGVNLQTRRLDAALERAYDQRRRRQRLEDFCTLYVAMTRARHGLYLLVKPAENAEGKVRKVGLCPAGILRDALGNPDDERLVWGNENWMLGDRDAAAAETDESADRNDAVAKVEKNTVALRVRLQHAETPRRHRSALLPSQLHGQGHVVVADLLAITPRTALERGDSIHAALESIAYLEEIEAAPAEFESVAGAEATLSHPAVRTALSRRYEQEDLWRERAFVVAVDGKLMRGSFDRVAIQRDAAGRATAAHLIDFKSDRVEPGSHALAQRIETYRPQVAAYRTALGRILRLDEADITAELIFTTAGVSIKIR